MGHLRYDEHSHSGHQVWRKTQINWFETMSEDSLQAVVLDPGSGVFKAGYAGNEYPTKSFQTVVGLPHLYNETAIHDRRKRFLKKLAGEHVGVEEYKVGEAALANRHNHTLSYPMSRGVVSSWDQMEFIFEHAFLDLLDIVPEETLALITEPAMTSTKNREKMAEFLFDVFGMPGIHMMSQAVLSLFSTGRTTGLVIDSGDHVTYTVPVYDGYLLDHCVKRLDIGGRDVTEYLQRLLLERGLYFTSSAEHHFVRELKESDQHVVQVNTDENITPEEICARWLEPAREKQFEVEYMLPDGQSFIIGREKLQCTEMLFHPPLVGKEALGISEMVWDSLNSCERDVKKDMYSNLVLVGGNTMLPGFQQRITTDLDSLARKKGVLRNFKVHSDPFRQFSSWSGGSIMASLSTFQDLVVTIDEWDEEGPVILEKKCGRM